MRDTINLVNEKIKFYTFTRENLMFELGNRANTETINKLDHIINDFKEIKKEILLRIK